MSDSSSLRVADGDREQLIGELRDHMLAGRLTAEEFEERVGRAYKATTRAELDAVSADLPMTPAALQRARDQRRAKLRARLLQEAGGSLGASAICVGIWLASGASGSFWPIWVILVTLIPIVRNAWRLLGPAPDLEAVEAELRRRRRRRHSTEGRRRELPR
ncbi:MAG TPA: DUF1707 domain-containing protein [Solirubrobacteraceae bacterium]|nr:DUF1707 domain-containing protein [Solirubrobacteraceae bacterium]